MLAEPLYFLKTVKLESATLLTACWGLCLAAGGLANHGLVDLVEDEGDSELRNEEHEDLHERGA
jgi:hypothetical protein